MISGAIIGKIASVRLMSSTFQHTVGNAARPAADIWTAEYGATSMVPSPNWDERPQGVAINTIVLHATATATGQEAVNAFRDPASKRSSHFVIDRNGAVIEMVPPEKRAWHAGVSQLDGLPDLNNYSIGIELADLNDGEAYTDAQYEALAHLIRGLRERFAIPDARIVSHAAVAMPPGRKTDPAGFNFLRLYAALHT